MKESEFSNGDGEDSVAEVSNVEESNPKRFGESILLRKLEN